MALSLNDIKTVSNDHGPRIMIYGQPGIGKTTLAAEFPEPIFLQAEMGVPKGVTVKSFGHLKTFDMFMEAVDTLVADPGEFQTVVIDSVTALEMLMLEHVRKKNAWSDKEVVMYGQGNKAIKKELAALLSKLSRLNFERGICTVWIAHAKSAEYDDSVAGAYARMQADINKDSAQVLDSAMDAILYLRRDVQMTQGTAAGKVAESSGAVYAYTSDDARMVSKNRYQMPPRIKIVPGKGFDEIAKYL